MSFESLPLEMPSPRNEPPVTLMRDVHYLETEYPSALRDLPDAPKIIKAEGSLAFSDRPVLGIVGARESSLVAETWMRQHLPAIAHQATILSGGARGIDELAHRIAVHERQKTVVILPSALDRPYPADWAHRKHEVLKYGGCFISEYESGVAIKRWHFEKRNRLIAALSDVVLVVEARRRSGSAITARHGRELGRAVATLPWFPSDPRGEYCNDLLSDGATMIRDTTDLRILLAQAVSSRCSRMLN